MSESISKEPSRKLKKRLDLWTTNTRTLCNLSWLQPLQEKCLALSTEHIMQNQRPHWTRKKRLPYPSKNIRRNATKGPTKVQTWVRKIKTRCDNHLRYGTMSGTLQIFEPGTSSSLRNNHTPRPSGHVVAYPIFFLKLLEATLVTPINLIFISF